MGIQPRIYFVIENFYPLIGGAETQTLQQCKKLLERGCEATVVTYRYDKSWPQQDIVEGLPIIRVAGMLLGNRAATLLASSSPTTGRTPSKFSRLLRKLSTLMAMITMAWTLWRHRGGYNILQVCEFSKLALPAALLCRLTRKPLVLLVISAGSEEAGGSDKRAGHGAFSQRGAKLVAGTLDPEAPYLKVEARTLVGGDLEGLERMGALLSRVTRALLQWGNVVIVILSSRMKRYVEAHNYTMHTELIPNGVDVARFRPIEGNIADRAGEMEQTVICVSQMRYEKGVDVLLQAWNLVHREMPRARLILVGRGAIQTKLREMARALGLEESVEFAGLQQDVPAQLQRGTVAVLPSRWEGLSNALLEKMASGLACVATRVSGSEDIIQHGVNGLLVEPEDYQGMAQALLVLLRDPALARKYGCAARKTIEKDYVLDHIADRYLELYQKITDLEAQQWPEKSLHSPAAIGH